MRIIITIILLFIVGATFGQKIDLKKRLDYLKNHHLFVIKVEFERKKNNQHYNDSIIACENTINRNIKICIDKFWDLNDSVKYISLKDIKYYSKIYPDALFLDFIYENLYVLNLKSPKKNVSLNDISPRFFNSDTTLLGITQEIRLLRYNIIHGNTIYSGGNATKIILILNEPADNDYHQQFIDEYKTKYPKNYQIEDRQFINKAVYFQDHRFVYIYRLCIINCDDGSMLQL